MKVSVLIPTRNRPELLRACLASVLDNTMQPHEIIVVDQSEDQLARLVVDALQAVHPHVKHLKAAEPGKSRSLNMAAEIADGFFIGITDDDCVVASNWLETFNTCLLAYPNLAAMTGQVRAKEEGRGECIPNLVLSETFKIKSNRTHPWHLGAPGGNMFVRKDVLSTVGKFDESMGPGAACWGGVEAAEDADLIYRILSAEYSVAYNPDLIVYHSDWRTREDNNGVRYDYALGLGTFAGKYLKIGDPFPFLHISLRFLQKLRRMVVGLLLFERERIRDGYLHITGISIGFLRRLFP